MEKAKVFEETYQNYLEQLTAINIKKRAVELGADVSDTGLIIPFYHKKYKVSDQGVTELNGDSTTFAIKIVLCKYVLMCPQNSNAFSSELVTYREFKDAGPLISYFTNNTNKTIEETFSGKLPVLKEKCKNLGGIEHVSDTYDVSYEFMVLPKIPLLLNFNDRDEMFSAGCSLLYQASAEKYLDMECLAITGTYLTGALI